MMRLLTFFCLVALAGLAAAAFGALHNQLSYTAGPDYFHSLKFTQFATPTEMAPRLAAALVGVQASWWMGVLIGLPVMAMGLLFVRPLSAYWAGGITVIACVMACALICAGLGLLFGIALVSGALPFDLDIPVPAGMARADFLKAGLMHEGAYLGGALGGLWGCVVMWRARKMGQGGQP